MVKSVFAKITDAKRFLCFLAIKNTPAGRKSPWDNHKSLRSTTSITTVAKRVTKKVIIFAYFFKNFEKNFCPKLSDFDGKLSGEFIFFGPMVLKNFVFSESGLFHKLAK